MSESALRGRTLLARGEVILRGHSTGALLEALLLSLVVAAAHRLSTVCTRGLVAPAQLYRASELLIAVTLLNNVLVLHDHTEGVLLGRCLAAVDTEVVHVGAGGVVGCCPAPLLAHDHCLQMISSPALRVLESRTRSVIH